MCFKLKLDFTNLFKASELIFLHQESSIASRFGQPLHIDLSPSSEIAQDSRFKLVILVKWSPIEIKALKY